MCPLILQFSLTILFTLQCFHAQVPAKAPTLSYDLDEYLEVYPDPTKPEVLRERTPLYFALIQSLGGPLSQFDGSGSIAGVKVALDRINNDTTLLPGYTLHYTFADSKCNRTEGIDSFFHQILREPTKVAIIGSGCSVTTEPTAEISHFYNITQISCVSSSTELRNRVRFRSYFQLLSTEETLAFAFYGVIREFGWRRVALIVQNENLFTVTMDRLKFLLDRDGVTYNETLFQTDRGIADLGPEPFDMNSRIYVFAMYQVNARPLLCEAYRRAIRLPRYLLLTPGWYSRFWWRGDDGNLSCTTQQRESVLSSTLAFLHFVFLNETSDRNLTTTTGITGGEFLDEERKFHGVPPLNLTSLEYSQYCYDATWTLAYALNETLRSISDGSLNAQLAEAYNVDPPFRLENFTYDSSRLLDIIFRHISETSFNGTTGPISFGDQGIRNLNKLIIYQFRNRTNATDGSKFLDWVEIGNVVPGEGNDNYTFEYGPNEDVNTVWQGGSIPYDGVPLKEIVTVHPATTVIFILLSAAGIVFAIACLIFNFKYRNSKLVRLASAKLNYFIGVGAIILYFNLFFYVIPTTNRTAVSVLCNLNPWLTAIGYSLCYGTILLKMARVYHIFNNPSANKKSIKDWMLILGVGLLVAIDLFILIIYTAVVGSEGKLLAIQVVNSEQPKTEVGEAGIVTNYCIFICESPERLIFLGILYGYKALLQIIALVLAFSIRKVKVKGLDDAKYIAAAIYVTSVMFAVIIVSSFTLKSYVNGFPALFSSGFIIGTTAILTLVFVPLMVGLYEDPEGEKIFSKTASDHRNSLPKSMSDKYNTQLFNNGDVETLRRRVRELEDDLETQVKLNASREVIAVPERNPPPSLENSVVGALGNAHMMSDEDLRKRTFSGTIWDTPEERKESLSNGDGSVMNRNANGDVQNKTENHKEIETTSV